MSDSDPKIPPGLFGMSHSVPGSQPGALGQAPRPGGLLSDFLGQGNALTNAGLGMPPPRPPSTADLAAALRGPSTELHTNPRVASIAGLGEKYPERLSLSEIQSLCGEVMRHVRRMKGEG